MLSAGATKSLKIALIITTCLLYPLKELKWPRYDHFFKLKIMALNLVTSQISCCGCWNYGESVNTARWNGFYGTIPSLTQACKCTDYSPLTHHWCGFKAKERMADFHLCWSFLSSSVWGCINAIELSKQDLNFQYNFHEVGPLLIPSPWEQRPITCVCLLKSTSLAGWANLNASAVLATMSISVFLCILQQFFQPRRVDVVEKQ